MKFLFAVAAGFLLPSAVWATVTGVVRNDAGKPVPGAFVRFVNSADSTLDASTYADTLGRYSLGLPGGVGVSSVQKQPGRFVPRPRTESSQSDVRANRILLCIAGRGNGGVAGSFHERPDRSSFHWEHGGGKERNRMAAGVAPFLRRVCLPAVVQRTRRPENVIVNRSRNRPPFRHGQARNAAGSEVLRKESATDASSFRIFVYGKRVFPFRADAVPLTDGGTQDFNLAQVDLWDSTRIILRDSLINCRLQFQKNKQGRIVFLGGSVTNMGGWRDSITNYLRARFPQATLDIVNQGVPSVGSNMHAFRLQKDIFSLGRIDLMFIDVAGNDTINNIRDNINATARFRAMEGIIRQARAVNPSMDLVELYIAYDAFYPSVQAHDSIPFLSCYERPCWYYGVPCVNLAQYVAERYTWAQFGGDVHPGPYGQGIYASVIRRLFDRVWKDSLPAGARATPHFTPVRPLDSLCYRFGHYDSITTAKLVSGWSYVPSWAPNDNIGTRDGFVNVPAIVASAAGATFAFTFTGTAVGVVSPEGPDVGILNCQIDGVAKPAVDQFTPWSSGLHIPWIWMFATDLPNTSHTLSCTIASTKDAASTGYAGRIFQFAVNGK